MIERAYIDTRVGVVHVAQAGTGFPVVLLHQTPRSWDEYREVLALLARRYRVIAADLPGMGGSPSVKGRASVEAYAESILGLVDALDFERVHLVGHHTGGAVAMEVSARRHGLVSGLVLSSTPYMDAAARARRVGKEPTDEVEHRDDGRHLLEMWDRRRPFYPPDGTDLLNRYIRDALLADDVEAGHRAVAEYAMERTLGLISADGVLCVGHDADPHAYPDHERLVASIPGASSIVIKGGMVPLEHRAEEFAAAVEDFLRHLE